MAASDPGCGISWNLLAGIGRIESMHGNGGATDVRGSAVEPILGPTLDGTLPGNEVIAQSSIDGQVTYARAMGPMQFLPSTWARYASDGDVAGVADPQNLYDSTLAAARYLCSGGLNLRDPSQVIVAILRYNNSLPYARNVLGWAAAYANGVVPVDLPPLTGAAPPLGDKHLENPEGLGPGLPLNVLGLPSTDPIRQRFDRLAAAAGLSRITFHDLRHSYATGALRAGVSPKVISERIGHANVGFFLDTYAHVLGNDDRDAAEQAASFLLGDAWDPDDETSS
jgi:hypothetical protein